METKSSLYTPEYSDWRVRIVDSLIARPLKGKEPNRFHRFMQRLILGFKWEKIK